MKRRIHQLKNQASEGGRVLHFSFSIARGAWDWRHGRSDVPQPSFKHKLWSMRRDKVSNTDEAAVKATNLYSTPTKPDMVNTGYPIQHLSLVIRNCIIGTSSVSQEKANGSSTSDGGEWGAPKNSGVALSFLSFLAEWKLGLCRRKFWSVKSTCSCPLPLPLPLPSYTSLRLCSSLQVMTVHNRTLSFSYFTLWGRHRFPTRVT